MAASYTDDQLFTSRAEIEKLLTRLGVTLRIDDEEPEGESIVDYYIEKGTSDVYWFLTRTAEMNVLALVTWVREQATLAAAYFLTTHGGEPGNSSLAAQWEKAEEKLEKIRIGRADVPGLVLDSGKGGSPVVSNLTVDMRRQPAVRVNRPCSTGNPAGYPIAADIQAGLRGRS